MLIQGFSERDIVSSAGVTIHVQVCGEGPPILLLHGYPQTLLIWRKVAPRLVQAGYSVVAADLRGYGDSGKPESSKDHAPYSKRAMAQDMIDVMASLGHTRFTLVGHDRGARVSHRLALDHPDAVQRVAVLDIVPTATMYAETDRVIAEAYYHWFFLIQPFDQPERMIGADPVYYLKRKLRAPEGVFEPEVMAEYSRCFSDPKTIHATCEDYRAGAKIDLSHDKADADARIEAPLLVLWGERGLVGRRFDPLAVWREKARNVRGQAFACGHYLPEEAPDETLAALLAFIDET